MNKSQTSTEARLPIRPVLTGFFIVLAAVAFVAAIAGENQKMDITARKLIERVSRRNYEDAYALLSERAKENTSPEDFKAKASMFRLFLRLKYGPGFEDKYSYYFEAPLWIPWRGDNTRKVSVGLYEKKSDMLAQAINLIKKPEIVGGIMKDLITVVREDGSWAVDELNFNPEEHAGLLQKAESVPQLFTPTEHGFIFEGFVYDRRAVTPRRRAELLDALKQAMDEVKGEEGKNAPSDDLLKMLP